jgi:Glycosyl transferase family 2
MTLKDNLHVVATNNEGEPFFSVCIPQHNRTSFLIQVLKSLDAQTFRDFEVCISDDCSTDGRQGEILDFLNRSRLAFIYRERERNGRYDKNLRSSIELARGRYCLLLGNDDALADKDVLDNYHAALAPRPDVAVATCNFVDVQTGAVVRRVRQTQVLPGTPATAVRIYRNFSFVGGVVLDRELAQREATDRWDGAEMYQTYLATRIIAQGHPVLCLDDAFILMGVQVAGERVDSVYRLARVDPCPIVERRLTLTDMGRLVADALSAGAPNDAWQAHVEWAMAQLYLFPYVYWLFTYRRIQSWKYAAGICLGMRPRNVLEGVALSPIRRVRVTLAYLLASMCGLFLPVAWFEASTGSLRRLAKRFT